MSLVAHNCNCSTPGSAVQNTQTGVILALLDWMPLHGRQLRSTLSSCPHCQLAPGWGSTTRVKHLAQEHHIKILARALTCTTLSGYQCPDT